MLGTGRFCACHCYLYLLTFFFRFPTQVADEKFVAQGLIITERNYLEVYPYDKWSNKEIPEYSEGETFDPTSIDLVEGETTAPPLLTEADLIALMVPD